MANRDQVTNKITGMYNVGEQGGVVSLVCNAKTHKLVMTYSHNGKIYDMFVFRKFGVIKMDSNDTAGKFFVGSDTVSQADVYYNVMNADKSFTIARFEVGSKAKWDIAVKAGSIPEIRQEGDEQFLVGDDWKKLLGALSIDCPFNGTDVTPIF